MVDPPLFSDWCGPLSCISRYCVSSPFSVDRMSWMEIEVHFHNEDALLFHTFVVNPQVSRNVTFTCILFFLRAGKGPLASVKVLYIEVPKELWPTYPIWKVVRTWWRWNIGVERLQEILLCPLEGRGSILLLNIEGRN